MLKSKIGLLFSLSVFGLISLLLIEFSNLDLLLSTSIYEKYEWNLGKEFIWRFMYDWGPSASLITSFIYFIVFILKKIKFSNIRTKSSLLLFPIITLIIGPGILVNLVGKELWGRPRPINCIELNGEKKFQSVFSINLSSKEKSFPSGHAATGFHLCTIALLLSKRWRFFSFFSFAIWGCLISTARILQGGHFLSDILGSFIIVSLVCVLFYPFNEINNKRNKPT